MNGPSKIVVYKRVSYDSDGLKFLGDLDTDIPDYWHRAEIDVRNDATDQSDFKVRFYFFGQMQNICAIVNGSHIHKKKE